MIPPAKLRALREALENGPVTFKNGSVVEREVEHEEYEGKDGTERVKLTRFVVKRPAGGVSRFREDELPRAYEMALNGPRPKEQPPSKDFGGVPY